MHMFFSAFDGHQLMRRVSLRVPAIMVGASLMGACAGQSNPAQSPTDANQSGANNVASADRERANPSASAAAPSGEVSVQASVVRFDDLGISFTVPPGYRVLGDEELASRIRASADLKLNRSLRERASQKKGLPLLTLERQTAEADDFLTISLSVVLVPKDARAVEMVDQQRAVMAEHLAGFQVTDGPKPRSVDNVPGAEVTTRYQVKRGGEAKRASSNLRVYVQEGLATIAVAVWPEGSPTRGEEARLVLDGLHFAKVQPASM